MEPESNTAMQLRLAAQKLISSKRCVVFTGAGMSADSGIDTFRSSSNGFWTGMFGKIALMYGGTPIGWRWTPGIVWSYFISSFLEPIYRAGPHDGYFALAEIQQLLFKSKNSFNIITMNVDGFHQLSGISNGSVSEIHGTIRKFECITCSQPITVEDPIESRRNPPKCPCGGYPRPCVTLFTENLPVGEWRKATDAIDRLSRDDVMIVIGTSSVVYPAASLPEMAKQEKGATIIEINPDARTPLSNLTDIHLVGGAKDMLTALLQEVKSALNS